MNLAEVSVYITLILLLFTISFVDTRDLERRNEYFCRNLETDLRYVRTKNISGQNSKLYLKTINEKCGYEVRVGDKVEKLVEGPEDLKRVEGKETIGFNKNGAKPDATTISFISKRDKIIKEKYKITIMPASGRILYYGKTDKDVKKDEIQNE